MNQLGRHHVCRKVLSMVHLLALTWIQPHPYSPKCNHRQQRCDRPDENRYDHDRTVIRASVVGAGVTRSFWETGVCCAGCFHRTNDRTNEHCQARDRDAPRIEVFEKFVAEHLLARA